MEKINRIKLLDEEFVRYDTPLILADGVSAGKGNYIPVKISYDKNKTDEKKVWVTPYTTVEDEKEIRKSGAIVTTTGGKISHASIVTNEFGIPAVNIPNGIWEGGKLYAETLVDDKIELRELKEGSTLLVNGETGHILIFDEIENKVLEKLQQYIDEDEQNINEIIKFIKTNEHNKNVNKLLEYMFFQLPEKSIIEILNSKNISNNVRDKLQTLITVNLKQVEQQIEETILNIKSTGNIIVKYMLVKELDKKIENISNINSGLIDKYTVYRKQVLSGVNKFVSTQLSAVDEMSNLAAATDSQKTEFLIQLRKIETLIPYLETNTENKNLEELKNKTITLKENILASIEQTNTTNIKSSEEKLTVEDFIKYGAKFINTAITSKILRENEKKLIKENIKVEIPSAYSIGEDFLMKLLGDKAKEYMELNKELDIAIQNKDYDNAKQISENIYSLIGNNITNKEKLNKILEKIDDKTIYAVRSSGLGEDEGNSFAGMGKTNLNVTKENIVESIVDSWQAFYLETPISYMISNRKRVKPCIMVQPFIVGEKSGVAFSSNKEGNSIISVGYGLGEGIVNSSVPADTIVANISNGEIIEYVNVNKKTQILPKENETGTGTEMKFVEDEIKAQSRALSNNEVKALMKVVKILEEEYGYPIDVEWTIKDGTIYILQVRPITILNVKEDEGQNISKAASLFDNLFSDKTTKFYKFWTIGVAPIIETLVFIVIPYFILFSTNPLGFATVAVIVFALSHLGTDIINKIIKPSAKLRSLADIRTIGMAGAFFAGVFLAVNLLLPGYSLIAFVASLIIHSIYNYISTKTDKLPAATLYNHETEKETEIEHKEWPISNEETFDIKEIYEDVGIERFLEEMKKWKEEVEYIGTDTGLKHKIAELADKLYSEQKYSDAADIIFMAYKLDLLKTIKDHDWKNIRNAGYDGTAFYYNSIAENYPQNEELEDAVKKNIKKLKSSGISGDFGKEIKKIRVRLENILEVGINDKNIPIIHELFQDYHEKINNYLLENGKSATSIDEAVILLKAVIPLYKEIIDQKFEFNDEIFESFKEIAMLVYPVDFDKEYDSRKKDFDEFVNFLTEYIVKTEKVTKNHYKLVVEIAKSVYKGISYHSDEIFDENKYREAVQRKKDTIDILKKFKDKSKIDYILFANDIFKDVILDETTLNLLFKSLKNTWYEYELELNEDDGLNDEIQNLIVNNCSNLDMGYMCHYFYFEHENAEGNSYFTESIIKKLMNIYDNSTNEELKESAAIALGEIYSVMYEYIDNKNIISIDELNNFYEQKDMNYVLIKNSSYMSNLYDYDSTVYGTRSFYKDVKDRLRDKKFSPTRIVDAGKDKLDYEFNITPLILKSNYNEDFEIKEKAPVFIKKYKVHSLEDREELSSLAEKFDALKALMENNSKAMLAMNREDFDDTFKYLKEMINCIRVINEDDADMCEKSLKKIKADVNQNNLTSKLNSLINTVHQTGIEDFRTIVRYKNINEDFDSFQNLLKAEHKGTEIRAYNLSEKETVNPEIYKMISNLALDKHNIDLFFKDDIVVWSIQLLAHSVDIIFDFGNKDRGIKIYYNESGSDLSNEWRIDYFNRVLKNNLNFGNPRNMDTDALNDDSHTLYVENDGYGIRVSLDNNTGLKDETDLVDIATKVIKLFEYSINLDHKFENVYNDITYDYLGDTDGKIRVEGKIEGFVDVFMKGEMPFNYNLYVSNIYSEAPLYMDKPGDSRIKKFKNYMNDILENLGLEQIPEDVLNEEIVYMPNGDEMRNGYGQADRNFFQNDIDKYFNKPIEQAYIEGRIIFNSEGKLVKNKNYNLTDSFINMFEDENTLVNVAEIIKTVPEYNKNYYSIEFAFGDLVTRTSEIKLNNRSIYIKELFDPLTNSIEYAQAELVTMSGREILTDKKLKKILTDEGYEITNIWTSGIEKANRKNKFKENILQKPEQLIDANVTSKGKNKHFIGEAVFDEDIDNINEDKILFKKFTTDDDFSAMKKSGGIITTAGGELSHAAIKATELDKPSLILNKTEWKTEIKTDEHGNKYSQKYLDVTYYKPTGETEIKNINGTDTEMQKIQKDTVEIRQGDKILMSTENGFIVKLSDENSEIQCSEIDKYSEKLKQKRKNIWKQEIIKELGIITEIASKQVAEILLFDVREKMMDTTLPLTEQDRKYIEKEMKQTKNKIYENISEQDYSDENKEETDNFTKEKDILSLNDIKANQKNMFGGKTVELAKIIEELKEFKEYNVIVTEGIGLSKNVTDQYCGGKLKELNSKLKELIKENKKYKKEQNEKELKKNEKEINKVRNEIKELIENSNNKEIEQYILENIDRNKYYAVRSSGIGEDGREYSFAGMGKSILNVKGSENVINAVKAVWKSFYDEEAIEYMLNTGQFIQPAVLIDEMVEDPDSAGVAVSRNENHNLLINAAKGLGDKVVDGTVTPDTIEVDTITGETIEYKSDIGRILTQEQVKQLNETIMFLEDKAGFPIDVEFAFKGDKLYILQRRAYTKFSMAEQVKQKIHPNIKFDKINKDVKELFFIEHENNAVPVYISFDKETKQITFVLDEQYQHFDSERILKKIINRVNEDFVARAKVNRNLPIFSNVIAGQLEFLPFVPVNNFEINDEDFDELKNSKNVINILGAA